VQPTTKSRRGLRKNAKKRPVPRSLLEQQGTRPALSDFRMSSRNTWKIIYIDMSRVTGSCITGSTCTIWKSSGSEICRPRLLRSAVSG
jgi:hypothetical protein